MKIQHLVNELKLEETMKARMLQFFTTASQQFIMDL
jgi:hypothetical protein